MLLAKPAAIKPAVRFHIFMTRSLRLNRGQSPARSVASAGEGFQTRRREGALGHSASPKSQQRNARPGLAARSMSADQSSVGGRDSHSVASGRSIRLYLAAGYLHALLGRLDDLAALVHNVDPEGEILFLRLLVRRRGQATHLLPLDLVGCADIAIAGLGEVEIGDGREIVRTDEDRPAAELLARFNCAIEPQLHRANELAHLLELRRFYTELRTLWVMIERQTLDQNWCIKIGNQLRVIHQDATDEVGPVHPYCASVEQEVFARGARCLLQQLIAAPDR